MSKSLKGLALIEVLIAMAILSIALTAIIKSSAENIRSTRYLTDKTIAHWVGLEVVNEARLNLIKLDNEALEDEMTMLGRTWKWKASLTASKNKHISEIHVDVRHPNDDAPLVSLVSYLYVA